MCKILAILKQFYAKKFYDISSSFMGLDSVALLKHEDQKLIPTFLFGGIQSSQPYSDSSPYEASEFSLGSMI